MIERVRRLTLEEGALAALVLLAGGAFAHSREEPAAWLVLLPAAASVALRLVGAPARVRPAIERGTWLALGLLGAVVLNWLVSPTGQGQPAPPVPAPAAYGLALLGPLLFFGRGLWPPTRAALPAALGTMVLAGSQSGASMRAFTALAALGVVVLLAAAERPGPGGSRFLRAFRFAVFGVAAAAVASAIVWFLPWAQPRVVQAAARAAFPDADAGFSLETRLGEIEELRLSTRVVLRVWTDLPQKLRGAVATRFDGRSWHSVYEGSSRTVPPAEIGGTPWEQGIENEGGATFVVAPPDPGPPALVRTRVLQVEALPATLVAPAGLVLLRGPLGAVVVDASRIVSPPAPVGRIYAAVNQPGGTSGPGPPAEMLAVPSDTDPRIRALANRLAAGATTEGERVRRTVAFLAGEYRYSLRMGRFHTAQPVAEFLFDKKKGWCQYFASAAALLLRLEGVPTRLVSGFQLRPGLRRGDHYVVRQADAHAWIEVFVPGEGWVEVDPTPPGGYDAAHGGEAGPIAETWERLKAFWGRLGAADWPAVPRLLAEGLISVLGTRAARGLEVLAAGLLGLDLLLRLRRRILARRAARPVLGNDTTPELVELRERLDQAWAREGSPRPPSRGLAEHVESASLPTWLRAASRRAVDAYHAGRFGGQASEAALLASLGRELSDPPPGNRGKQ